MRHRPADPAAWQRRLPSEGRVALARFAGRHHQQTDGHFHVERMPRASSLDHDRLRPCRKRLMEARRMISRHGMRVYMKMHNINVV
ncbi:protein of unknown function [Rhodovastum atsumiense]|nr:protein of unknown function [Rhodovastum atsumiense]